MGLFSKMFGKRKSKLPDINPEEVDEKKGTTSESFSETSNNVTHDLLQEITLVDEESLIKEPHLRNWMQIYIRLKVLPSFLEHALPQDASTFLEGLWRRVVSHLRDEELTWDTMNLLFCDQGALVRHSTIVRLPAKVMNAADAAHTRWNTLRCGNPDYALYEANSEERRIEIQRNLESLRKNMESTA